MTLTSTYLKDTTFENFDPNKLTTDSPLWAVYDGHSFKTYTGRGPALQAVMAAYKAKLYEFTNNVWTLRATKTAVYLDHCQMCNKPVERGYGRAWWLWKKVKGKITNPPELYFVGRCCADLVRYG